ncbi:MAG: hypothetical protein ACTHJR_05305 [Sphingomonas sp.]|uniref:hypothetical protein n=1 Tax=Sphingomonas sp. TaxID=28214 RepID=UPI003F80180D
MENPRTTTAREHDDNDRLEDDANAPMDGSTSGGNLARDVASRAEEERVDDPEARRAVHKQDDIDNDTAIRSDRAR